MRECPNGLQAGTVAQEMHMTGIRVRLLNHSDRRPFFRMYFVQYVDMMAVCLCLRKRT